MPPSRSTTPLFVRRSSKEAVELAIETLKNTGQKQNALVILSDGEKHAGSLDDVANDAKVSGVNILAIGSGT